MLTLAPAQQEANVVLEAWEVTELSQGDQDAEARDDVVGGEIAAADGVCLRFA